MKNEYVADRFKRREYLSQFTGSNGTAVITADRALLWTDGRYFLQAEQELDLEHWTLMKEGNKDVPSMTLWLIRVRMNFSLSLFLSLLEIEFIEEQFYRL